MKRKSLLEHIAELTGKPSERVVEKEEPAPPRKYRRTFRAGTHRGWIRPSDRGPRLPPGESILDKCVAAMEPGCWYAGVDICALAGITDRQWWGTSKRRFGHGWLMRRQDPDYQPKKTAAELCPPLYLYTLTPAGEERRRLLLAVKEQAEKLQEGD